MNMGLGGALAGHGRPPLATVAGPDRIISSCGGTKAWVLADSRAASDETYSELYAQESRVSNTGWIGSDVNRHSPFGLLCYLRRNLIFCQLLCQQPRKYYVASHVPLDRDL